MDDPSDTDSIGPDPSAVSEGLEHLQAAGREMLSAARSFLDLVEDVVEDPDKLAGAATTIGELLRRGLAPPDPPWADAAQRGSASAPRGSASTRRGASAAETGPTDDDAEEHDVPDGSDDPTPRARSGSRVRRIAVD